MAFHPTFQVVPWAVAAFVPALLLAFALRYLIEWTLALSAFWLTRVSALNQMYYVVVLFLSGQVAPLTLFPAPVQTLATLLPFRWMVSFPVELLLGRLTPQDTMIGFGAQIGWLAVAFLVLWRVWRVAVRHYSAVGS